MPNSGHVWNVAYCQITYEHTSIRYTPDAFTPTDGLAAIPLVPAESYYQSGYFLGGDGLELPDDLEESFDLFFALPAQQQDRFLQASYWLNQTNRVELVLGHVQYTPSRPSSPSPGNPGVKPLARGVTDPRGPARRGSSTTSLTDSSPEAIEGRRLRRTASVAACRTVLIPPFLVDTQIHFGLRWKTTTSGSSAGYALETARMAMHNWLRDPCGGCGPSLHDEMLPRRVGCSAGA